MGIIDYGTRSRNSRKRRFSKHGERSDSIGSSTSKKSGNPLNYKFVFLKDEDKNESENKNKDNKNKDNISTILFIHELGYSIKMWDEQLKYFEHKSSDLKKIGVSSLLFVDLPSHGESKSLDSDPDSYLLNSSRLIYNLITNLNISSLDIVGLGYGALEAIYLSNIIENPEKYIDTSNIETGTNTDKQITSIDLKSLVLVSPFLSSPGNLSPFSPIRTLAEGILHHTGLYKLYDPYARYIADLVQHKHSKKLNNEISEIRESFINYIKELNIDAYGIIKNLSNIPIGVISGDMDTLIAPSILKPTARYILRNNIAWKSTNSEHVYIIDNAGHLLNITSSKVFNEMLRNLILSLHFTRGLADMAMDDKTDSK